MNVLIRGNGVAASCCAHLLKLHGTAVAAEKIDRPASPVVMLSDPTLLLIRDVFGRPDLFTNRPRIDRRIVAWGQAAPATMPHGATIVNGADLEAALATQIPATFVTVPNFTIHAAARASAEETKRFGARAALATEVHLRDANDATACWIESLDAGWLFLIPSAEGRAWLLCVGPAMDDALARSHLIAPRITIPDIEPQTFDSSPRIATELSGPDWLACGSGAIAFDPICGDGTAQAVREAILASAVASAIRDGGDAAALTAHYGAMLTAAMRRHLQLSAPFYRTGGSNSWWRQAHDALAQGHDWCTARLAALPEPRYMLREYSLVEREHAA